ncbi:hypothetical protein SBOR_7039 [Sclerotinia borealis F-4128]|uniref:Uncharacterized protein n=1 Tax=Sclerotinia borealis (strain F-4128) TaxID=1432307 RepID=W9CCM3_SCLBF|nr:hypothetical protein SBOR_7039 [Sclerotinia borealis F-4128]
MTPHLQHSRDLLISLVEPSCVRNFSEKISRDILLDYKNVATNAVTKAVDTTTSRASEQVQTLASRMLSHISSIERLVFMNEGKKWAFDLVLLAGRHSNLDHLKIDHDHQVFDAAADNLLLQVAKAIKQEDPTFRPADAMEILIDEIETTGHSGYFPQSYKLFLSWMPDVESAHVQKHVDDLHARIADAHAAVQRRLIICINDHSSPTSDLLGRKMREYIDDVVRLSHKLGGLLPAIDLMLFLGECSYTKMKGLGPLYGWTAKGKFRCNREFDLIGDTQLEKLLDRADREDRQLDENIHERIKKSIDYLKPYGITTYFPSSYRAICRLLGREA